MSKIPKPTQCCLAWLHLSILSTLKLLAISLLAELLFVGESPELTRGPNTIAQTACVICTSWPSIDGLMDCTRAQPPPVLSTSTGNQEVEERDLHLGYETLQCNRSRGGSSPGPIIPVLYGMCNRKPSYARPIWLHTSIYHPQL